MPRGRKIVHKKLGEVLISRGLVTEDQLNEALAIQKKENRRIGEILVRLKYITEESIVWALTVMYGYPYLPLDRYSMDKEVIQLIPEELAKKHQIVAVDHIGSVLTIAVVNPLSETAIQEIETITKCKIEIFISMMTEVNKIIQTSYDKVKESK